MGTIFHILKEVVSITIAQSYIGKYYEFVAICIVTNARSTSNNANSNK